MTAPLEGIRVIEIASAHAAYAGKLLADYGADVTVIEPSGGHASRWFEPFAGDVPDPEHSLWWWHYNTSKHSRVLDLDDEDGRAALVDLVAGADIVLEGEPPGELSRRQLDYADLRTDELVWVSVTPYGRRGPRADDAFTDLTVLADGGVVWMCGYDDHSIPPVRGGGNQGFQTASLFAAMAALTAIVHRDAGGPGQFVDVSMHAAANITTEAGTYEYLVAGETVQRLTGRHANVFVTTPSIAAAADGRAVHTGVPPRSVREFEKMLVWLDDLELTDEFTETFFLHMGVERGGVRLDEIATDVEAGAIFNAGREVLRFIAGRLGSYEFFREAQEHGFAAGIVYAPEEVLGDPHFIGRGFPTPVDHDGETVIYPGLPIAMLGSPGRITRAPRLGESAAARQETRP